MRFDPIEFRFSITAILLFRWVHVYTFTRKHIMIGWLSFCDVSSFTCYLLTQSTFSACSWMCSICLYSKSCLDGACWWYGVDQDEKRTEVLIEQLFEQLWVVFGGFEFSRRDASLSFVWGFTKDLILTLFVTLVWN